MKSDADIRRDILDELRCDTRTAGTEIDIRVTGGVVLLTGAVSSPPQRLAIQSAVSRVVGVRDLVNDLRVRLPESRRRADPDLARAIRRNLTWNVRLPADRIHSTVTDGWVTLTGDVDAWTQKDSAERAIRVLIGVRGIVNQVAVLVPQRAPAHVRQDIEAALERRLGRLAHRLQVGVRSGGSVILNGLVASCCLRQIVLDAVWQTAGVRAIDDRLSVEPLLGLPVGCGGQD